jgi:ABC-2 type transport system permease protein
MAAVVALALKDLRLLLRDKMGFFFTLIFPLMYAVFFGLIMGGMNDEGGASAIPILVVDEDRTAGSARFLERLKRTEGIGVEPAESLEAAVDQVARGRRAAYLRIAAGFGAASERIFWGEPQRIELGVDPSRSAEAGMLQGIVMKVAFTGFQEIFSDRQAMQRNTDLARAALAQATDMDPASRSVMGGFFDSLDRVMGEVGAPPAWGGAEGSAGAADAAGAGAGWQPVEVVTRPITRSRSAGPRITNSFTISFPQAIVWGVMGAAAAFGISMVSERTGGTLARLRVAPISRTHVLAGKALACFITIVTVATFLLAVAMLFFGVRPGLAALPHLVVTVAAIGVAFVGIMMLLSVLGRSEAAAGGIGWAALVVMAMLGGGMIPLFLLKGWMRTLSHASPVKWAILSMEGVLWRGFDTTALLLPWTILVAVGVVTFAVGAWVFARRG